MQFKPAYLLPFGAAALLFFACTKRDFDGAEFPGHTSEYAFPLFQTSINTDDILPNLLNDTLAGDTLIFHPDRTVTLIYSGKLAEKPASDIFTFFSDVIVPVFDTVTAAPTKAPDGVDLHYAQLKSGEINLWAWNTTRTEPLTCHFFIPQMTKNGQPFDLTFTVPPTTGSFPPSYASQVFSVAGYELTSEDDSIYFRYEAFLPDGTPVEMEGPGTDAPPIAVFIKGLKFQYVQGYWGYQVYQLTRDVIEIDINQTNLTGNIRVKDPKVTMTVRNSWGFPTTGKVKYLSFIGKDGITRELVSTVLDTAGVEWDYPSYAADEVGQTKVTDFVFDGTNSNIADIFNSEPVRMIYEVDGIANIDQDTTLIGFITDSSTIQFAIRVELLLEGAVRDFAASDTIDLDLNELDDLDPADYEGVEFKLVTENELPMAAKMQLYFQDAAGTTIDSLFQNGPAEAIKAAPVGADGRPTTTARAETFIPMDVPRFNRLKSAERAFFNTYLTTTDDGQADVKVLSDSNIRLGMGVKVKRKFD